VDKGYGRCSRRQYSNIIRHKFNVSSSKKSAVVPWCRGAVVLWCCGAVVLWCCGAVVLWCRGAVVP